MRPETAGVSRLRWRMHTPRAGKQRRQLQLRRRRNPAKPELADDRVVHDGAAERDRLVDPGAARGTSDVQRAAGFEFKRLDGKVRIHRVQPQIERSIGG